MVTQSIRQRRRFAYNFCVSLLPVAVNVLSTDRSRFPLSLLLAFAPLLTTRDRVAGRVSRHEGPNVWSQSPGDAAKLVHEAAKLNARRRRDDLASDSAQSGHARYCGNSECKSRATVFKGNVSEKVVEHPNLKQLGDDEWTRPSVTF